MASRNIFLPKESNRRIPNGTYGGVRGMNNLYSIAFPTPARAVVWFYHKGAPFFESALHGFCPRRVSGHNPWPVR